MGFIYFVLWSVETQAETELLEEHIHSELRDVVTRQLGDEQRPPGDLGERFRTVDGQNNTYLLTCGRILHYWAIIRMTTIYITNYRYNITDYRYIY